MIPPDELKKIFTEAAAAVLHAFNSGNTQPPGDATPAQLIDAINQFFIIYEKLGSKHNENSLIKKDDISQIGDETINCLVELGNWAERLALYQEKAMLDEIALAATHWVIRHQGEIRSLEAIVNMLAAKANRTSDTDLLSALFHVMHDVIEQTTPELKSDPDKSDPARPWRMLNFNYAIVATRTMNKELMIKAFDNLGRNLPEDCPGFFEEGLKQSEKAVYGPEIKAMMAEYFKKWATLH
ncbi:MAG: hypothetical protein WC236_12910 [Gallionellaceae bacterium]|jgi:hypothetical protein